MNLSTRVTTLRALYLAALLGAAALAFREGSAPVGLVLVGLAAWKGRRSVQPLLLNRSEAAEARREHDLRLGRIELPASWQVSCSRVRDGNLLVELENEVALISLAAPGFGSELPLDQAEAAALRMLEVQERETRIREVRRREARLDGVDVRLVTGAISGLRSAGEVELRAGVSPLGPPFLLTVVRGVGYPREATDRILATLELRRPEPSDDGKERR